MKKDGKDRKLLRIAGLQRSYRGREEDHASLGVGIIRVLSATALIDASQVQQGKSSLVRILLYGCILRLKVQ